MDQFSSNPFAQGQGWSDDHHRYSQGGRHFYQGPSIDPSCDRQNAGPNSAGQDEFMANDILSAPDLARLISKNVDLCNLQDQPNTMSADSDPWDGLATGNTISPHLINNRPASDAAAAANNSDVVVPQHAIKRDHNTRATSDSGYTSIPVIATGSLPPDYRFKAGGSKSAAQSLQVPGSVKSDPSDGPSPAKRSRSGSKTQHPDCRYCLRKIKNASDAKKHLATHTKPNRCKEVGCSRIEGFATTNDLERHRNSVHPNNPAVGSAPGYICDACPHLPTGEKKWWPRKDNFVAHIGRKHKTLEVEMVLSRSLRKARPTDVQTVSHASVTQEDALEIQDEEQHSLGALAGLPTSPVDNMSFMFDARDMDSTNDMGSWVGDMVPPDSFQGPAAYSSSTYDNFSSMDFPNPSFNSTIDASDAGPSTANTNLFGPLLSDWGATPLPTIPTLEVTPSSQPSTDPSPTMTRVNSDTLSDGLHMCQQCGKITKRNCELRKHFKRHTRPYGCTFPHCSNRFGSRNDWKRHERQRHFLQESWRCELLRPNGTKCGKLMYNRDVTADHLQRKHALPRTSPQSEETITSMHMGRQGNFHFWCGFCDKLIALSQDDCIEYGAWELRFKHIGDHFDKEGKDIEVWVCVEKNLPLKLLREFSRSEGNLRHEGVTTKEETTGEDEDSDLGDAGIKAPAFLLASMNVPLPPHLQSPPSLHMPLPTMSMHMPMHMPTMPTMSVFPDDDVCATFAI